jgi:nicotinamidase/pyrazinamidase
MPEALVIVDFQNDFTPGGALEVPQGDEIAERVRELLDSGRFELVVATRDWHPDDHGSFETADPPGIWPVHCVQGTEGSEFAPGLDRSRVDVVVDKGVDRDVEGYSGFERTTLEQVLREHDVDSVTIVGLATDYCVRHTALDALRLGFAVEVDREGVRGIDVQPGDVDRTFAEITESGGLIA